MKEINKQELKQLIRIKFMLQHALEHSNKQTEIDAFISFLGLDNVVENLLNLIVSFFELEDQLKGNKDYIDLADYSSQINKLLIKDHNIRLSNLSDIKLLRKTRNLIQHNLVNPGVELERFVKTTQGFFDYSLHKIFNLSENDVNDFILIKNEIVKEHIRKSKSLYEGKKYLESIVATRDAFENTWFEIIKSSEINLSSRAANIEAKKENLFYSEYFERINDELIFIKLGVDPKNHSKFEDYLRHIPSEYCFDKMAGYTVMNRAWNINDAMFCYNFVFDFIMKYQNSINDPLYQLDLMDDYTHLDKYGNINISDNSEGNLSYIYLDNNQSNEMQLLYAHDTLKKKLDKLIVDKEYIFEKRRFYKNKLDSVIKYKTILLNISFDLITNSPPRWQTMLWFKHVPFTWHSIDYLDGEKIKESININKVSMKKLKEEFSWAISTEKVSKIINLRKAIGRISSIDDLKKIKELSADDIAIIAKFSRI